MTLRRAAVLAGLLALPASAQDYVATSGPLDDDAFYRLVACGAAPGGACAKPFLRWPVSRPVTVGFDRIDRAYLGGRQKRARAALSRAVQYLNQSGAAVRLEERGDGPLDVRVLLLDTDGSAPLSGTGVAGLDGAVLRGARVQVWAGADGLIDRAVIAFSTNLHIRHYESVMLEELTQALGLMTDIRNPAYDGLSVLAQDSNAARTLGPQDIMALRRHYSSE